MLDMGDLLLIWRRLPIAKTRGLLTGETTKLGEETIIRLSAVYGICARATDHAILQLWNYAYTGVYTRLVRA